MQSKFCVIDIETKGLSARPEAFVFGCIYAHNFQRTFFSRSEMAEYLLSNKNPYKYIYAHNGEFDFTILFDNIIRDFDNSALFVGSTFVQAKKRKKLFSNSLPILKSSVKELGKNLGIEKGETPDVYIKWKPGDGDIKVERSHIEYCLRDCEIVYVFLEKVFNYTGKMKPTIASCAMHVFTTNFLTRPLKHNPLNEVFRESYYGGRVECFRFGEIKPCYKYDVNSLYPYVCTKMNFPDFNTLKRGKNMDIEYFKKYILKNYEGCVKVKVLHRNNFVGVLPYRKDYEIIYPYGVFTAWYNFNELRYAIQSELVEIREVYDYVYSRRIQFTELREYMLHFYNLKNNTAGAEKLMNKFFLNALTGKFGQKQYGRKTYFENPKEAIIYRREKERQGFKTETHTFSEHRQDCFIEVWEKPKSKKTNWNLPTVSSYITSESRIYMLQFFLKYQDYLCYTDTDSLVLTKPLDPKYISDTILGAFKKENDTQINIFGNKHYSSKVDGKKVHHIKGVGRNFKRRGKKFYFNKMIRTKEALRREDMHAGMFIKVIKHLSFDYTKRTVSKNNRTKILRLAMK